MTRDRAYRPGMPATDALAELQRFTGRMFDPCVVEPFQDAVADLEHLIAARPASLTPTLLSLLTVTPGGKP